MSNADELRDASPWQPIKLPLHLALLGKLLEELNECGSAASRCIIQGVDECEPVSGKSNREWLEDEIADVTAGIALISERFDLNHDRIFKRVVRKMAHLRQWHVMLEDAQ
jgi:NTP pyrophosphatase (non-canonical NTP hydrolase)